MLSSSFSTLRSVPPNSYRCYCATEPILHQANWISNKYWLKCRTLNAMPKKGLRSLATSSGYTQVNKWRIIKIDIIDSVCVAGECVSALLSNFDLFSPARPVKWFASEEASRSTSIKLQKLLFYFFSLPLAFLWFLLVSRLERTPKCQLPESHAAMQRIESNEQWRWTANDTLLCTQNELIKTFWLWLLHLIVDALNT